MSKRLGFQPPDREKLTRLLKAAAKHKMTPREIWLQRVSFVYGQMMDCAPLLTREDIEKAATELYGPCPEEETYGNSQDQDQLPLPLGGDGRRG